MAILNITLKFNILGDTSEIIRQKMKKSQKIVYLAGFHGNYNFGGQISKVNLKDQSQMYLITCSIFRYMFCSYDAGAK
jgi:hypothetical protein